MATPQHPSSFDTLLPPIPRSRSIVNPPSLPPPSRFKPNKEFDRLLHTSPVPRTIAAEYEAARPNTQRTHSMLSGFGMGPVTVRREQTTFASSALARGAVAVETNGDGAGNDGVQAAIPSRSNNTVRKAVQRPHQQPQQSTESMEIDTPQAEEAVEAPAVRPEKRRKIAPSWSSITLATRPTRVKVSSTILHSVDRSTTALASNNTPEYWYRSSPATDSSRLPPKSAPPSEPRSSSRLSQQPGAVSTSSPAPLTQTPASTPKSRPITSNNPTTLQTRRLGGTNTEIPGTPPGIVNSSPQQTDEPAIPPNPATSTSAATRQTRRPGREINETEIPGTPPIAAISAPRKSSGLPSAESSGKTNGREIPATPATTSALRQTIHPKGNDRRNDSPPTTRSTGKKKNKSNGISNETLTTLTVSLQTRNSIPPTQAVSVVNRPALLPPTSSVTRLSRRTEPVTPVTARQTRSSYKDKDKDPTTTAETPAPTAKTSAPKKTPTAPLEIPETPAAPLPTPHTRIRTRASMGTEAPETPSVVQEKRSEKKPKPTPNPKETAEPKLTSSTLHSHPKHTPKSIPTARRATTVFTPPPRQWEARNGLYNLPPQFLAACGSIWDGESGRRVSGRRNTVVFAPPPAPPAARGEAKERRKSGAVGEKAMGKEKQKVGEKAVRKAVEKMLEPGEKKVGEKVVRKAVEKMFEPEKTKVMEKVVAEKRRRSGRISGVGVVEETPTPTTAERKRIVKGRGNRRVAAGKETVEAAVAEKKVSYEFSDEE